MTAQVPNSIFYKRRSHYLYSEPLEAYFREQKPKPEMFAASCTACWRGYLAAWGIRRGRLHLDRIAPWPGPLRGMSEIVEELCRHGIAGFSAKVSGAVGVESASALCSRSMAEIFPGVIAPIFAEWYSGELHLVSGEMLSPNWGGYGGSFQREIVLLVEQGRVIGEKPKAVAPDIPSFLLKIPPP